VRLQGTPAKLELEVAERKENFSSFRLAVPCEHFPVGQAKQETNRKINVLLFVTQHHKSIEGWVSY
jgi:hypothetical protein